VSIDNENDEYLYIDKNDLFNINTKQKTAAKSSSQIRSNTSAASLGSIDSNYNSDSKYSEVAITSPGNNTKYKKNYYSPNKYESSSGGKDKDRARIAKESLERLEREKDDLYEL
jgi:hypothetical protein